MTANKSMTPKGYMPRISDKRLKFMLETFGAVCVEGPKWCGKTWTALNQAKSAVFVGDPKENFQNRELARMSPSNILEGERPRLIDEWQEVPPIWDAVRFEVDKDRDKGQFILTGSATPNRRGILHSGTGRFGLMRMHTMSLFESGDSEGKISLESVVVGKTGTASVESTDLKTFAELIVRGGWPESVGRSSRSVMETSKQYLESVIREDFHRVDGAIRDQNKIRMLIRSIARNEGAITNKQRLLKDISENEDVTVDVNTISSYMDILTRLFVLEEQPAFSANLRSSVRVGKTSKIRFTDPSLTAAALEATPDMLMNDLKTFGFLFESMCIRDLRIYSDSFGGKISHYRDYSDREVDAIIQHPEGKWGAFEIKLGMDRVEEAAGKLIKFRESLDEKTSKNLSALGIICGTGRYAYTREDGVSVIPITALRE